MINNQFLSSLLILFSPVVVRPFLRAQWLRTWTQGKWCHWALQMRRSQGDTDGVPSLSICFGGPIKYQRKFLNIQPLGGKYDSFWAWCRNSWSTKKHVLNLWVRERLREIERERNLHFFLIYSLILHSKKFEQKSIEWAWYSLHQEHMSHPKGSCIECMCSECACWPMFCPLICQWTISQENRSTVAQRYMYS